MRVQMPWTFPPELVPLYWSLGREKWAAYVGPPSGMLGFEFAAPSKTFLVVVSRGFLEAKDLWPGMTLKEVSQRRTSS